ncbi:MAG: TonB-dependent receptor domain-containing protein, partial [Bryobacteraceae bacterium]
RYTLFTSQLDNPPVFGKVAGGLAVGSLSPQTGDYRSQHAAFNYTHTFGPTLLTEARVGLIRFRLDGYQSDAGLRTNEQVGIPNINTDDILTQGLAGIDVFGPVGAWFMGIRSGVGIPRIDRTTGFQWVNNWTKIFGSHQLRWGADIRRNRFEFIATNASSRGNFQFAPSITGADEAAGSGLGMASFLLGMPSNFNRAVLRGFTSERMTRAAFYWQDIWRATPKLTLNYGLRYDYYSPVTPGHPGGLVNFDINTGDLLLAGLGDVSNTANVQTDWNNVAPRLGAAYKLTSKTVLRAGFGRSYFLSNYGGMFFFLTSTYPIAAQQTIDQSNIRFPIFPIEEGPPTPTTPEFPASGHLPAPRGELLKHRPFDNRTEYIDSWNLTLEHQLANDLRVSVGYVGNVGRKLWRALNINAAPPGVGPLRDRRRFFQEFGLDQQIQNGCNCENSNYNSLQFVVEKRFSEGYWLNSAFTWSKALDLRGAPNPLDRRSGYGPSEFDRAAIWVLSHTWDLPYGAGRRFGASAGGIREFLLGGWKFQGITTLASGFPFTPTLSDRSSINADFGQRPDVAGDPRVPEPNRERWFDPSAFSVPQCCRLGNAGTNILRGPSLFTVDWSFGKEFQIRESMRLDFRWENYNLFNHANLALPATAVDSPTAGRIFGLAGSQSFGGAGVTPMRRMQLGARLSW